MKQAENQQDMWKYDRITEYFLCSRDRHGERIFLVSFLLKFVSQRRPLLAVYYMLKVWEYSVMTTQSKCSVTPAVKDVSNKNVSYVLGLKTELSKI